MYIYLSIYLSIYLLYVYIHIYIYVHTNITYLCHRGGLGRGEMHLQRRGPAPPDRNSRKSAPQSDNVVSIRGTDFLGNFVYINMCDDSLSVAIHLITTFLAKAPGESVDGDGIRVFNKAEHRETHTQTHK